MMTRNWIGFLALALTAHGQSTETPQSNGPASEITTHEERVTFRERVNLVSVPVVVRDSKGRAVSNLEKDDFLLTDGGKPQIVAGFTAQKFVDDSRKSSAAPSSAPEAETATLPGRFVALLFDDLHTRFANLVWARQAAEKVLASLGPTERAAIYTTSGQNGIDFTADFDKLRKELNAITSRVKESPGQCPEISYYLGDLILNHNDGSTKKAMRAELRACFTSSQYTDEEADRRIETIARQALLEGDWNTRQAMTTLRAVIGKLGTARGGREIVLISDGFLLLDDHREIQSDLLEAAVRANVIVNGLNARGLQTSIPGGDASTRGTQSGEASLLKSSWQRSETLATEAVLAEAASGTGGRLFQGSNAIDEGMERLAGMPECVYVLGFSPQNLKFDGRYHTLKVTLRNSKGLTVEARRGYYAPNRKLDAAQQAREEIQAAFFSTETIHEIPAEMEAQYFKTGDEATVDILAKIGLKQLNFRKEADRNKNDVTIVTGLFDENGNYVSGMKKVVEMRFKDQTLADRMAAGVAIRTSISGVRKGRYAIRMVLRDSEGQELTALSGGVEIP